jgi:5'(3')-deoxyribonucleotidase
MKKILYLDMDGVLVDFQSGIDALSEQDRKTYKGRYAQCPRIFSLMKPYPEGLEAATFLQEHFDVYLLSSPSWGNASAWSDKHDWVNKHLPSMKRRLILSSQKHLNRGDYLIDDRTTNGAADFEGEHIHFGTDEFPDWPSVLAYLKNNF